MRRSRSRTNELPFGEEHSNGSVLPDHGLATGRSRGQRVLDRRHHNLCDTRVDRSRIHSTGVPRRGSVWTHNRGFLFWGADRLIVSGADAAVLRELFGLMSPDTLVICDDLDFSLALGRYSIPPAEDGASWTNSPLGTVLNSAKYHGLKAATAELESLVRAFVVQHPILRTVDLAVAIPPSNLSRSARPDLAPLLVGVVADVLVVSIEPLSRTKHVASQKTASDLEELRQAQSGSMSAQHGKLAGASVLLVDDLYGSGATMEEASRAVRASGARLVYGLVIAKTAKFMQGYPYEG